MSPPSIFTRPKRQTLQTLGTADVSVEARTFDQLVSLVGKAAARPKQPLRIVIAAPITATATITLPDVDGLTIEGIASAPITIGADLTNLFVFGSAFGQRLVNLSVNVATNGYELDYLANLPGGATAKGYAIVGNQVSVTVTSFTGLQCTGILDATGLFSTGTVRDNLVYGGISSTTLINGDVESSIIAGNISSNASSFAITGGGNAIIGNNLNGGTIDTSGAAIGLGTIVGNTNSQPIASHATDDEGLNT